jgi:hypothetical protein
VVTEAACCKSKRRSVARRWPAYGFRRLPVKRLPLLLTAPLKSADNRRLRCRLFGNCAERCDSGVVGSSEK